MGIFQGLPLFSGKIKGTIGKSAKKNGVACRVCFDSWICCGDIKGQRGVGPTLWRMGFGAIWRSGVTWRRVLRTKHNLLTQSRVLRTIMIIHIQFISFDELEPEISWAKGSPGYQTGGTPSRQSGDPMLPGGECFAPQSYRHERHIIRKLMTT